MLCIFHYNYFFLILRVYIWKQNKTNKNKSKYHLFGAYVLNALLLKWKREVTSWASLHVFTPLLCLSSCPQVASGSWRPGRRDMALGERASLQALEDAIVPMCFCWDDKYSQRDILRKNYINAIFLSTISGPCMSHSLPSEVLALLMKAFDAQYSKNPSKFYWDGEQKICCFILMFILKG